MLDNARVLLLGAPCIAIVDRCMIGKEERHLTERFGDVYAEYRSRVRRWL